MRLDPTEGRVVVGPLAALARSEVRLHGLNWLGPVPPAAERPLAVKLRSTSPPVQALVAADGAGGARVVLADPQNGVAPGQACVIYDGDRMLGGGWIARPLAREEAA